MQINVSLENVLRLIIKGIENGKLDVAIDIAENTIKQLEIKKEATECLEMK